jgi:integrase/recombinase XerC
MVEARDARVQRYLDHAQFEKRLAQRTLILYSLDLVRLQALARAVPAACRSVMS